MARTVAIGLQDFKDVIERNCFYIDKTDMIREWWEMEDRHLTPILGVKIYRK